MKICFISFLSLLLAVACSTEVSIDQDAVEKQIVAQWDSFVTNWESENAKACAEMYTPQAVNIPPESTPKKGRVEIEAFYQLLFDGNIKSEYVVKPESIKAISNDAIELGNFQVDWTRNDSSTWTYKARYIAHWEKNEDGKWLINKFLFNNPPDEN